MINFCKVSWRNAFIYKVLSSSTKRITAQAVRYKHPLSLVIFDIDHFKRVNDNFGHAVGDKVLAIVSGHVRSSLRVGDIVGRYGGEEFVILLPHTSTQAALQKVERIRKAVASLVVRTETDQVSVTISSGIAELLEPEENDRLDQLLERADRALYTAKAAGRNQTIIYQEPDLVETLSDTMRGDRTALSSNEVTILEGSFAQNLDSPSPLSDLAEI